MNRILKTLFIGVFLLCVVYSGASAAHFESAAEELAEIGIFRGTSGGSFELDRAPTRSEAAIMLTRLYGAEEEAIEAYSTGAISHPFTDVSVLSSPYVAWLYTEGILKGTSATTFSASQPCTLQNYVVFLLRALGYKDGIDFQYADALSFSKKTGLSNPYIFSKCQVEGQHFLRDDLARLTWQALYMDKNGGETWLLQSLVESKSLEKDMVAPIIGRMELIRASLRGEIGGENPNPWRDLTEQEKLVLNHGGKLLCDYEYGSESTVSAYVGEGYFPNIQWYKQYVDKYGVLRRVDLIGNSEVVPREWLVSLIDGEYPRNISGETYGAEIVSDYVGYAPDLLSVIGENGIHGFIRHSECPGPDMFLNVSSDYASAVKSYLEWEKDNPGPWNINLYDQNGNIVGDFRIERSYNPEDLLNRTESASVNEIKEQINDYLDN